MTWQMDQEGKLVWKPYSGYLSIQYASSAKGGPSVEWKAGLNVSSGGGGVNITMDLDALLHAHGLLCKEAAELVRKKNHDYTSGSGDPFFNFRSSQELGIDPRKGILLRMQDKIRRLDTAIAAPLQVEDEGVRDTVKDLINYSILYYGLYLESKQEVDEA